MEKTAQNKNIQARLIKTQIIKTWKPATDVWPFLYGDDFLGTLTIVGSTFVTHTFRKALNLRPYARVTCYAPVVGLSAIGCYAFQSNVISGDVFLAKACPLCISTKSCLFQSFFGVGFPLLIAPLVCFFVADRLLTYPIPPLARAPLEVFSLFRKIISKKTRPILIIGALHIAAAWFITYQKEKSFYFVESSLMQTNVKHE